MSFSFKNVSLGGLLIHRHPPSCLWFGMTVGEIRLPLTWLLTWFAWRFNLALTAFAFSSWHMREILFHLWISLFNLSFLHYRRELPIFSIKSASFKTIASLASSCSKLSCSSFLTCMGNVFLYDLPPNPPPLACLTLRHYLDIFLMWISLALEYFLTVKFPSHVTSKSE